MSRVVIIGAGVSGLASAALLAREGHEVTVLEARPDIGGRAATWERNGFRFDLGPSWYLMPEVVDHFYRLLGTSADEQLGLVTLDPAYRAYFDGDDEPFDIAAESDDTLEIFEDVEQDAGERLARYLESARETYDLVTDRFLYANLSGIRSIAEAVARGPRFARLLLQSLSSFVSARFRDRRLQRLLEFPAFFLGTSPRVTPSLYHLMSRLDLEGGVLYPMGGFGRVVESIAELARAGGARIVTGADVTRILVEDGAATGVEYVDGAGAIQFEDADIVVSAADLHRTETRLLKPEDQTYPQEYWDARTPTSSALLLCLGVEGALPQLQHHTLLFGRETDASTGEPSFLYIAKPSGVDPSTAPDGSESLVVLVPLPADPLLGRGDTDGDGDARLETLADKVIAHVAGRLSIPDLAERVVVRRTVGPGNLADEFGTWQGSGWGAAHTLRQGAFPRFGNASKNVRGLYYVGDSTIPGPGVPMSLVSAEALVKRLRGDRSTGPLAEPLERVGEPVPAE